MKPKISLIFLCTLLFTACGAKDKYAEGTYFAMDTYITVSADTENTDVLNDVHNLILAEEDIFSATKEGSIVSIVNSGTATGISAEYAKVITKIFDIAEKTEGAFNPCLGLISDLWDITGKKYVPSGSEISALLPYCDYSTVRADMTGVSKKYAETKLDLGAAIKGYAAEESIKLLKESGVDNAMVSIGGNIGVTGHSKTSNDSWRVGIKNPFNPETVAGYIDCTDTVISVSGDYERYFEKDGIVYHHIFDTATGKPADSDIKSVAVISNDGLTSDALSTAIFVMGSEKALSIYKKEVFEFEAIIFLKDKTVLLTDGINDRFHLFEESGLTVKR